MNLLSPIAAESSLPALVRTAAQRLANAESSAEVLDARDMASAAYDMAKSAARLARAKQAHDEIIGTVYRAQADALAIEAAAKSRLADEYDAAQARGEVRAANNLKTTSNAEAVSASDIGLSHKEIHEARQIRDAEKADPGIVRRTVDGLIEAGEEPTKAAVKRAINAQPAKPRVSDKSLWLWGRLRDLERENILNIPMAESGGVLSFVTVARLGYYFADEFAEVESLWLRKAMPEPSTEERFDKIERELAALRREVAA